MIASLVRQALAQRLVVLVIALALLGFGLNAARNLSLDALPDVTNVQVQIATEAPGRSPEEVERFATVPIEIAMTGMPGLEEMRSLIKPGLSLITLVFTEQTDVYFARQLVMERLIEIAGRMPAGMTPVLGPVSTGLGEIFQYTLERDDDGNRQLTEEELTSRRTTQDWVVRPLLRSITGVAEINSQGGYQKQYQVLVAPERLRYYRVTLQEVFKALASNNANSGGGVLPQFAEQYLIRGIGLINSLDDIGNIVVREADGAPVFIRDVADVKIGTAVRVGALLKNGVTESVGGVVMMLRAGNAQEIVTRIQQRVAQINDSGMLPDGLKIRAYYDRSELVGAAVQTVVKVLLEGVAFVLVILFLFLGDLRSALVVVATLILTPLLTFMAMNRLGISANLMSLGGLAIAIGLMVDGSVVVVENAFAHLAQKAGTDEPRHVTVLNAVKEIATPVIFGVGIIILVFLPLMTLQGMEGKMFSPLAYTIALALFFSLILSMTLSPVLSSLLLKVSPADRDHETWLIRTMRRPYTSMLDWAMARPKLVVLLATLAFAASVALVPFIGTSFIPDMKEGSIVPGINRTPNISLDESIRMENEAMRLVMEVPGVKSAVSSVGRGESPADPQAQNESTPIVSLKPRDQWPEGWTQDDIADAIREKLKALPGVMVVMAQPISDRVDEMLTGVRADIAIKIFGDDIQTLREKADEVVKVAQTIPGARDMRPEKITGQQYLEINIDRQAIARFGLNVADINDVIETAIGGKQATEIFEGERRYGAVVRLPEQYRDRIGAIRDLLVRSPSGAQVPLDSLARIEVQDGPAQISREMGKRRVVVGVNVEGRDLGGFVAELQQALAQNVRLPPGYSFEWGGQYQNMERAMGHLMVIVPITVAAIFFLLFMLFQSVRYAVLIILVLPFASMGGLVGLFVTREYLSVPASVGFIALWGIAVLNGVVLISSVRSYRQGGEDVAGAARHGALSRFRPVMMTATVAMLGLIPFLFATGPGSEVQRPLAIVVISGLISCTLLTLVMLPSIYPWFDEEAAAARRQARRDRKAAAGATNRVSGPRE